MQLLIDKGAMGVHLSMQIDLPEQAGERLSESADLVSGLVDREEELHTGQQIKEPLALHGKPLLLRGLVHVSLGRRGQFS